MASFFSAAATRAKILFRPHAGCSAVAMSRSGAGAPEEAHRYVIPVKAEIQKLSYGLRQRSLDARLRAHDVIAAKAGI